MGKKNIVVGDAKIEEALESHKRLMTRRAEADPEYLKFLRKEVKELFVGFKYSPKDYYVMPTSSYCLKRGAINLHNFLIGTGESYRKAVHGELEGVWEALYKDFLSGPHVHEVKAVVYPGKTRIITTNHPACFLMKPFQDRVHGYLKRMDCFRFIGMQVRSDIHLPVGEPGEKILSGDYENSTDFIPKEVTRTIYEAILERIEGEEVLKQVVRHAIGDERLLYPDGEEVRMTSGQLMGGLLSFPALCIHNLALTRWFGIKKRKINGDDLLARTTIERRTDWVQNSESFGLKPNDEKSHFHQKLGTFNSQLLEEHGHSLHHVDHTQIGKLSKGSLVDFCNRGLPNSHTKQTEIDKRARTWLEFHDAFDLFTGEELSEEFKIVDRYEPRFREVASVLKRENVPFTFGEIGEFSFFFDEDDRDFNGLCHWSCLDLERKVSLTNGALWSVWRDKKEFEGWLFEVLRKKERNEEKKKEKIEKIKHGFRSTK